MNSTNHKNSHNDAGENSVSRPKAPQFPDERVAFNWEFCRDFVDDHQLVCYQALMPDVHELIHEKRGPGNEALGWLEWPLEVGAGDEMLRKIQAMAEDIQASSEVFVVVGVGGSYLGPRAVIDFLRPQAGTPTILYLGHHMSPRHINETLNYIADKDVFVNVISKSGGTLESSLAFRVMRAHLEHKYGKRKASQRIIATTGEGKGILSNLAEQEGYQTLPIPEAVGGRYSVFTPVGLLPLAVAGIDIQAFIQGAREAYRAFSEPELKKNAAYQYAVLRHILYQQGKVTELLATYDPYAGYLADWWKQLFGESEGKDGKGIFPARADFTTDLHALGQYIQEGRRHLFITTVWWETHVDCKLPAIPDQQNEEDVHQTTHGNHPKTAGDALEYLEGKSFQAMNRQAFLGTVHAHVEGGVPNMMVMVPDITPYYMGELLYFFMKACAASGYLLGVNPFNQPGVEAYKKNVLSRLKTLD